MVVLWLGGGDGSGRKVHESGAGQRGNVAVCCLFTDLFFFNSGVVDGLNHVKQQ